MSNKIPLFFKIWVVVLILNQVLLFGSCFAPYCIIAALPHTGIISYLLFLFYLKAEKDDAKKSQERIRKYKESTTYDPLKMQGDQYEMFIGKKFQEKGDLVIYNGFIRGYDDKGVDLVVISERNKSIILVQCKNWHKYRMNTTDVLEIYRKLNSYDMDFYRLNVDNINEYLERKLLPEELQKKFSESKSYDVKKALYIASEKVIDLKIGENLKMIKPNIFAYKDMKIVFVKSDLITSTYL